MSIAWSEDLDRACKVFYHLSVRGGCQIKVILCDIDQIAEVSNFGKLGCLHLSYLSS